VWYTSWCGAGGYARQRLHNNARHVLDMTGTVCIYNSTPTGWIAWAVPVGVLL